jgi:hypothetical protein
MAFTVRSLYAKIGLLRPDLDEAKFGYTIQEVVRRVARETGLMREILAPFNVNESVDSVTITPTSSNDLLRIIEVRSFAAPIGTDFVSNWNASTNSPTIPAASSSNTNKYYLVTTAGTTTVDDTSSWAVGDILISDGTQWVAYPVQQYQLIREKARPTMDYLYRQNQFAKADPQAWSQERTTLRLYPRTQADAPFLVEISYVPVGDISTINLPAEAEDVIINGSKVEILALPGENQDKSMARVFDNKFQLGLTRLRIIAEQGYGGSPIAESPCYQEGWP